MTTAPCMSTNIAWPYWRWTTTSVPAGSWRTSTVFENVARSSGVTPPENGSCARNCVYAAAVTSASPPALVAVDIARHRSRNRSGLSCMVALHVSACMGGAGIRDVGCCGLVLRLVTELVDHSVAHRRTRELDPRREGSVPAWRSHRRQAGDQKLERPRPRLRRLPRRRCGESRQRLATRHARARAVRRLPQGGVREAAG